MIRMIQRRLIIPRGDTGSFSIPYLKPINAGDVAVFTIFDPRTHTKMYQKLVAAEGDMLNIAFSHGDTVNLKPGKYLWDIKFYTNPQFVDDELVNGDEIDSYYAGFTLPECEIRQTGDALLTSDDAPTSTIAPETLNIINAAISEALRSERIAAEAAETTVEKAAEAAASATSASTSASAAEQSAALAVARVNEIENLSVEVSTGEEGTQASATYTPSTGVLSFEIPRGDTGNGIASCVLNADFTLTINYTDGTSMTTVPIRGDTPHLTIGQVTEGPNAIATITGTDANPVLNLTLPNANVPTRVSQLENDAGYLTEHQDLSDYVQKTDYATANTPGVVKTSNSIGILPNGAIGVIPVNYNQIREATDANNVLVAARQHASTFYGLAKAAGDTTQSQSSNAIGTYTNEAKAAIQTMLDVPSTSDIPTQVSELTNDAGYLTTETDPTVPAWAKAAQKPSYTAAEVGAPTVQEMNTAIGTAIGQINSFDMAVVQALPTQDISTHTIYLVPKTGETNDVYDEYVYINNAWEMVGNTQIDLSNYVQKTDIATNSKLGISRPGSGLYVTNSGAYTINMAPENIVKRGTGDTAPIVVSMQHAAAFYGLATAAGDTTQSQSDNAVGTYTNEAKAAIQTMLDVPSTTDLSNKADKADTILDTTLSRGRTSNTTVGTGSFAFGDDVEASGAYSVAFGRHTAATGQGGFAEGQYTTASYMAHAEGGDTTAAGAWSHAEGRGTEANGAASHASGDSTIANGTDSFVFGKYNIPDSYDNWPTWTANTAYAVGDRVKRNTLVQNTPTDVGYYCTTANEDATFDSSKWKLDGYHMNFVEIVGNGDMVIDPTTHEEVRQSSNARTLDWNGNEELAGGLTVNNYLSLGRAANTTIGQFSVALGTGLEASGIGSFATGYNNVANATASHAEGYSTLANGVYAHSEGLMTTASGMLAHSDGFGTVASGECSHTFGNNSTASGTYSSAEGQGTVANGAITSVQGSYNVIDTLYPDWAANTSYQVGDKVTINGYGYECKTANTDATWTKGNWTTIRYTSKKAFIIGNGTANNARSNAYVLDWDGNGYYKGDIYVHANADSTGGTKVATVSDIPAVPVQDVQINGNSILDQGIANILIDSGLYLNVANKLAVVSAGDSAVKAGTAYNSVIMPINQHKAVFYGLSKVAGIDMASSSNTVGTYTDEAKTAIKSMLGVQEGLEVVRLI